MIEEQNQQPIPAPEPELNEEQLLELYGARIAKLDDRSLLKEIRRNNKTQGKARFNSPCWATILEIVLESHLKGMNPFLR